MSEPSHLPARTTPEAARARLLEIARRSHLPEASALPADALEVELWWVGAWRGSATASARWSAHRPDGPDATGTLERTFEALAVPAVDGPWTPALGATLAEGAAFVQLTGELQGRQVPIAEPRTAGQRRVVIEVEKRMRAACSAAAASRRVAVDTDVRDVTAEPAWVPVWRGHVTRDGQVWSAFLDDRSSDVLVTNAPDAVATVRYGRLASALFAAVGLATATTLIGLVAVAAALVGGMVTAVMLLLVALFG